MIKAVFIVLFSSLNLCQARELTPYIVGGEFSDIREFPHSVCLSVRNEKDHYDCGSSILNQWILLTAAHCVSRIDPFDILVQYGHAYLPRTMKMYGVAIRAHPNYVERDIVADIAVVKTSEPLKFNRNVRRIAIFPMKDTPYNEEAYVAGWGLIDEISEITSDRLKHLQQNFLDHDNCEEVMGEDIPEGTFCGYNRNENSYASSGDSGSALVVKHYIQVGLVSAKKPYITRAVIIYTDVGFYYNWIKANTLKLMCSANEVSVEID